MRVPHVAGNKICNCIQKTISAIEATELTEVNIRQIHVRCEIARWIQMTKVLALNGGTDTFHPNVARVRFVTSRIKKVCVWTELHMFVTEACHS